MHAKASYKDLGQLTESIKAARGQISADIVIKNAQWLDVFSGEFRQGDVAVHGNKIVGVGDQYIGRQTVDGNGAYIVPGFIDSHVHIESSLMTPVRFQQAVLPCGTTSVIWDPHEIANVKGKEGIRWALESSDGLDLDVFVMVPSCVPSTTPSMKLETSGATLFAEDLREFVGHPRVLGLAEMMNFPGLLEGDDDVMAKLLMYGEKRRDGHCPGLSGKDLNAYGVAGIHSCHESTTLPEAVEKLSKGIHVLIREGSCAKDADVLLPILNARTSAAIALCSDDRNPADIAEGGHISCIIDKALKADQNPVDIFRAAAWAPARMYGLNDRGAIAPGYIADFCMVAPRSGTNWTSGLQVLKVFKNGLAVESANLRNIASRHKAAFATKNLNLKAASVGTFSVKAKSQLEEKVSARVIGVRPGQILTDNLVEKLVVKNGMIEASREKDILKIAVLERHHGTGNNFTGFVKGFGLKSGAIATSINHDSHNVIVVGSSDELMTQAVNALIKIDGGIVVVHSSGVVEGLPLPIGGLMTDVDPDEVTTSLHVLKALAQKSGCSLVEPFLQLSFLALPVIPSLKITDKGLVDVSQFQVVSVQVDD